MSRIKCVQTQKQNFMKRLNISLKEYTEYGGKLDNLDLTPKKLIYTSDKNQRKTISSVSYGPIKTHYPSGDQTQLYNVLFIDGTSKDYAGEWIEISVDFILSPNYQIK